MKYYTTKLTDKQYNDIKDMNHYDRYAYAENLENGIIGPCEKYGYGFYGMGDPYEKDGEYFAVITIGNSCD